jgi:hypothetical protein
MKKQELMQVIEQKLIELGFSKNEITGEYEIQVISECPEQGYYLCWSADNPSKLFLSYYKHVSSLNSGAELPVEIIAQLSPHLAQMKEMLRNG